MGFVVGGDIKSICSSLMNKCKQVNYFESEFVRSKVHTSETSLLRIIN